MMELRAHNTLLNMPQRICKRRQEVAQPRRSCETENSAQKSHKHAQQRDHNSVTGNTNQQAGPCTIM
jgi:hypothetical protein